VGAASRKLGTWGGGREGAGEGLKGAGREGGGHDCPVTYTPSKAWHAGTREGFRGLQPPHLRQLPVLEQAHPPVAVLQGAAERSPGSEGGGKKRQLPPRFHPPDMQLPHGSFHPPAHSRTGWAAAHHTTAPAPRLPPAAARSSGGSPGTERRRRAQPPRRPGRRRRRQPGPRRRGRGIASAGWRAGRRRAAGSPRSASLQGRKRGEGWGAARTPRVIHLQPTTLLAQAGSGGQPTRQRRPAHQAAEASPPGSGGQPTRQRRPAHQAAEASPPGSGGQPTRQRRPAHQAAEASPPGSGGQPTRQRRPAHPAAEASPPGTLPPQMGPPFERMPDDAANASAAGSGSCWQYSSHSPSSVVHPNRLSV
jgi:hypothetical protein